MNIKFNFENFLNVIQRRDACPLGFLLKVETKEKQSQVKHYNLSFVIKL